MLTSQNRSRSQSGISLVELMVSITIALILLTGLLAYLVGALKTSSDTYENSRLNQELNAVLDLMARDIRRSGYWGSAQTATTLIQLAANPFTAERVASANDGGISLATAGCILYAYDLDSDGALDSATEQFGFKLVDGTLYTQTQATACSGGSWQPVSDPAITEITGLTFEYLDGNDAVASPQKPIVLTSGSGWSLCTRNIKITLTGRLLSDPTLTARTLTQNVRVRNDWYNSGGASC